MIPGVRGMRNVQSSATRRFLSEALVNTNVSRPFSSRTTQYNRTSRRPIQSAKRTALQHGNQRWASSSAASLKLLPLDAFHRAHGAKMVEFAEHSMPLVYSDQTHLQSHHWTRDKASLFDVGHMLQHTISGPLAESFIHKLTPSYLPSLVPLQSTLSVLLHPETGGIVDDTMITRMDRPETFRLVTNGATATKVISYIESALQPFDPTKISWSTTHSHDSGLLALQGPLSADILAKLLSPLDARKLKSLYFGQSGYFSLRSLAGAPILVSRGGYTGEDGFELATSSPEQTVALAEALYTVGGNGENLRLAGLGARDSLRLEAGMCLYGHDLDDSTTPIEAALGWVVAKERRQAHNSNSSTAQASSSSTSFNGAKTIISQLTKKSEGGTGITRKRVGLSITGVPAREGAKIYTADSTSENDGQQIGTITSGGPSPTTGTNIAMGYVKAPGHAKVGTNVKVAVRGKLRDAVVAKMPFVAAKYYREPVDGGVAEKIKVEDSKTTGAAPM